MGLFFALAPFIPFVYLQCMKTFNPPISTRKSEELIQIIAVPEDWDKEAVEQANNELIAREIDFQDSVKKAALRHHRKQRFEQLSRAKASYSIGDFIFQPIPTLLEILISWELKKDGYLRKAKQQKIFRIIIFAVFIIVYLLFSVGVL